LKIFPKLGILKSHCVPSRVSGGPPGPFVFIEPVPGSLGSVTFFSTRLCPRPRDLRFPCPSLRCPNHLPTLFPPPLNAYFFFQKLFFFGAWGWVFFWVVFSLSFVFFSYLPPLLGQLCLDPQPPMTFLLLGLVGNTVTLEWFYTNPPLLTVFFLFGPWALLLEGHHFSSSHFPTFPPEHGQKVSFIFFFSPFKFGGVLGKFRTTPNTPRHRLQPFRVFSVFQ